MANEDITKLLSQTTSEEVMNQRLYRVAYQMAEEAFGELSILSPILVDRVALNIYESFRK